MYIRFREGKYGTKFIPEEYPQGFKGVELSQNETSELVAATVVMELHRKNFIQSADNYKYSLPPSDVEEHELIAVLPSKGIVSIYLT